MFKTEDSKTPQIPMRFTKIIRGILLLLRKREIQKIYSIKGRHTHICWRPDRWKILKEPNPSKPLQESEKINLRTDLELIYYC